MRENDRGGSRAEATWPWRLALALLTLGFFLCWFNRFAGLRSGDGEYTTGMAFLHGLLPYRDYFSATPALNTLKSALLLKLFGRCLIVSRSAGVAERVLIVLVLFEWLRRLFPMRFAFLASLVTIVVSAGDRSDPLASYNHDALLFAIVSGYCASRVLSANSRKTIAWALGAGVFAGLSLLTKQTVGLGAAVVAPVAVGILLGSRAARRWLAAFAAGCATPVLMFAAWLARMKMVGVFATMVFLKGPAAKGHIVGALLRRELQVAWENRLWVALGLIALALGWRALRRSERFTSITADPPGRVRRFSLAAAMVFLAAAGLGYTGLPALEDFGKSSVYFVMLALMALLGVYIVALFKRPLSPRQAQFALLAIVSFCCAFLLSLSWPAFEAMCLPGLGFLLAAILDGTRGKSRRFVYLVAAAMVFIQIREKLAMPFSFGSLDEGPVRMATARSSLPQLKGMRFALQTRDFLDRTTAILDANAKPSQTIFTYPEMGLFYSLADRTYPTLSGSHNVDVVNDTFALEESARLRRNPPAAIVFYAPTPTEVAREDAIWRFGKPSGQHVLVATLQDMLRGYHLAGSFRIGPDSRVIEVYVH